MLASIQRIIRNYFGFSQKETNGVIVLFMVMLASVIVPWVYSTMPANKLTSQDDVQQQEGLVAAIEKVSLTESTPLPDANFYPFDPNKITKAEWIAFGLNEKVANRIENYLKKGGKFRKKEDVRHIYDFPEDLYEAIESFIVIENTPKKHSPKQSPRYRKSREEVSNWKKDTTKRSQAPKDCSKSRAFDINLADTAQLKKLRGIGEKRALSIIRFREKLGGFASMQQIEEIFGLDSVSIASLKKCTFITPNSWKKIAINTATEEALKQHPYIGYRLASVIVKYRLQHGKYKSEEDLAKIRILENEKLQKLRPYIVYD
jgi:DNA uptake protein ComE-like DNA-binding protein